MDDSPTPQGHRDHYVDLSEEVGRMMREKATKMEEEQLVQEGRLIREEGLRLMKQRHEGQSSEVTEMEQGELTDDSEAPTWFKAYMEKVGWVNLIQLSFWSKFYWLHIFQF